MTNVTLSYLVSAWQVPVNFSIACDVSLRSVKSRLGAMRFAQRESLVTPKGGVGWREMCAEDRSVPILRHFIMVILVLRIEFRGPHSH
jgi:hypothetical protein